MILALIALLLSAGCGGARISPAPAPAPPITSPLVPDFIQRAWPRAQSNDGYPYVDRNGTQCDPSWIAVGWDQAIASIQAIRPGPLVDDRASHVFICLPVDIVLTGGQEAFRVSRLPAGMRQTKDTYCDAVDCYVRGKTCVGFDCNPQAVALSFVTAMSDPTAFVAVVRHEARFWIWQRNWPTEACPSAVGLVWQHVGEGDACDPLRAGGR